MKSMGDDMVRSSLIIASLMALAGCGADSGDSTIEIVRNLVPSDGCTVVSGGAQFLSSGIIDTAASSGYVFSPEIRSNVGASELRTNLVFMEGANIEVDFLGDVVTDAEVATLASENLTRYRQNFSGSIEPGGQNSFIFEILPQQLLSQLGAGILDAGERVSLLNGGTVGSNIFSYPIDVCNGCLVNVYPDCAALPPGFVAGSGGSCQDLQDGVLDCCMEGGVAICPATAPGEGGEVEN